MNPTYLNGALTIAGILTLNVNSLHAEPAPRTITIATMGTSLTSGESAAGGAWQPDLKDALEAGSINKFNIHNYGIGGARSNYPQDPSKSGMTVLPQVVALNPDIVTIEYAMNDCVDLSIAQTQANLTQMVNTLRGANPNVKIILMTMNPIVGSMPARNDLDIYNDVYRSLSVSLNTEFVDTYQAWGVPNNVQIPDNIHPTRQANLDIFVPLLAQKILDGEGE